MTGQTWSAEAYAANGRFVADLAGGVVEWLAPRLNERILDVGCGDGVLTQRIAELGATMVGVDAAEDMLRSARERGVDARRMSADALQFNAEFDAVFSNAALHWLPRERQPAVLAGIRRALKPGGRFVAEMGGLGNIAAIRVALQSVMERYGIDAEEEAASFYPSPAEYTSLLNAAGFTIERMELIPRPTPLKSGMDAWLRTFRNAVLDKVPTEEREKAIADTVKRLKPVLCDSDGNWNGDYVRLRFKALAT